MTPQDHHCDVADFLGHVSPQTGLTKFVGAHMAKKVVLTRKNGCEAPKPSCYYATL
jgi:hypothetical protein